MYNDPGDDDSGGESIPQPDYETLENGSSSKSTPLLHDYQDEEIELEMEVEQDEIMMDDAEQMKYNDNSDVLSLGTEEDKANASANELHGGKKDLQPFENVNLKTRQMLAASQTQKENKREQNVAKENSVLEEAETAQRSQQRLVVRSCTPMSREMLALQRSINESKILSEFATEVPLLSTRKRRKSFEKILNPNEESFNSSLTKSADQYGHITGDNVTSTPNSTEKNRKHASRFVPLKGADESCSSKKVIQYKRLKSLNSLDESQVRSVSTESLEDTSHNLSTESLNSRFARSKSVPKAPNSLNNTPTKSSPTKSNWSSDEKQGGVKRTNMRSQNSDFVQKQKEFLSRVNRETGENIETDVDEKEVVLLSQASLDSLELAGSNSLRQATKSVSNFDNKSNLSETNTSLHESALEDNSLEARLKPYWQIPPKRGWDGFCWKCHECADLVACSKCIRCFHTTCIKVNASTKLDNNWICPECTAVENVLNAPKRPRRNELPLDLLSQLLSFALKRMKNVNGIPKILAQPSGYPSNSRYIVNPVTFESLQQKIDKKCFRCAEEFVSETKWIVHNAYIVTTDTSNTKEVMLSKTILKICKQEANEIDTCAECYLNANTRTDWFVDVCSQPHLLLWAKLKGFPYWPAKSMSLGQGAHVNVRFFGEHDRAFVPIKDCYLLSEMDPNMNKAGKRSVRSLADCLKEVKVHIQKIKEKLGNFKYAPYRTAYDPAEEMLQLENMMPGVGEYMKRMQTVAWEVNNKPPLQYKIVKTGNNHLSIIKKSSTTTESGNDSDNSQSPLCKKQQLATVNTDKSKTNSPIESSNNISPNNSKYEVITKTDEGNNSKITAVILKRKADVLTENVAAAKKNDEIELPLSKMTKIENSNEEKAAAASNKEKTSNKQVEHEEKSVKSTKTTRSTKSTEVSSTVAETEPLKSAAPSQVVNKTTQSVVESLVKNKQGVTIKKITKDQTNAKSTLSEPKAANPTDNIFKDLIPFVEIKKEVTSEDETEQPSTEPDRAANSTETNASQTVAPAVAASPSKAIMTVMPLPELVTVKQEVFSDEETEENAVSKPAIPASKAVGGDVCNHSMATADSQSAKSNYGSSVRVVGDTTIQRISSKTSQSPAAPPSNAANSKRNNLKGVPFGPLPASAVLKNSAINIKPNLSNINTNCESQNARKNLSNANVLDGASTSNTSSTAVAEAQKRTLFKNSMVSIPVDVANNRNISNHSQNSPSMTNSNSIPIPPLTAVSKTIPTSTAPTNSVANCNGQNNNNSNNNAGSIHVTPLSSISYSSTMPPPLAGLSQPVNNSSNSSSNSSSNITTSTEQSSSLNNAENIDSHLLGSSVTPTLASAITEIICRGPPKLSNRPSGPLQSEGGTMFPSQAGPVCRTLVENAHKLTDFFISVMEDTMCEMSNGDDSTHQAKITLLTMELERNKQAHEQEVAELKRTSDMMLCEMRKTMENEKSRIANEIRKQCEMERLRSIEETKKKQWCAQCGREAQFYCCWNTSYCDYPCQQLHWSRHATSCAQTRPQINSDGDVLSSQELQQRAQIQVKVNTPSATSNSTHYNSKNTPGNKKDKHPSITLSRTASSPEVLKLPSNTYLRALPANTSSNSNANIRASANATTNSYAIPMSVPVQRFNIPLPITAPVNSGHPYTIVQRGSSWELMSTAPSSVPQHQQSNALNPNRSSGGTGVVSKSGSNSTSRGRSGGAPAGVAVNSSGGTITLRPNQ